MKYLIILASFFTASVAFCGSTWIVIAERGGEATAKLTVSSAQPYAPDPAKNEYPESYSFPATNMMYWKKVGTDWVEMDAAEKLAVDASKKEKVTVLATDDAINDALIAAIAEAIKQNAKTYDEVKAIFKGKVDPKKANKKSKEPKK